MKLLDALEKMDQQEYELKYANEITWTCTLSDGTLHMIEPDGNSRLVNYEERLDYCEKVKRIRLSESDKQVKQNSRSTAI